MKLLFSTLVLIVAACGQPAATAPVPTTGAQAPTVAPSAPASSAASTAPSAAASGDAIGTAVTVKDFTLAPKDVTATGSTVAMTVTNEGPTVHNITIRDGSGKVIAATKNLSEGQSETISTDIAPGDYILFCSLPGHESLGIKGTLTVSK